MAGVEKPLETAAIRATMLIWANPLVSSNYGCQLTTVQQLLLCMIENKVHPVVPCQGSSGLSGNLAPLVMIGECCRAEVAGIILSGANALLLVGLDPIELEAMEGLTLTNVTAMLAALGCLGVMEA
jgi:histidine ammonia-lyase